MEDPNIDRETGETIHTTGRSARFNLWIAFLAFATIVMISAIQVRKEETLPTAASKYVLVISIVTFLLTVIIVAAHFHPIGTAIFVGTKIEGGVVFASVILWSAIVAVNTDAGLAIGSVEDGTDTVQHANLYFFSWAGFVTSVVLLVSFLRDAFGVDIVGTVRGSGKRLEWWAALVAASVVVLGSAAEALKGDCKGDPQGGQDAIYCRRTKWAISASTICIVICLYVIYTKVVQRTSPFLVEIGSSFILAIMNVFVVFYTTSADGPGRTVGNLYYFSWAMSLISIFLASQCYTEYSSVPARTTSTDGPTMNGTPGDLELQVETFDDHH